MLLVKILKEYWSSVLSNEQEIALKTFESLDKASYVKPPKNNKARDIETRVNSNYDFLLVDGLKLIGRRLGRIYNEFEQGKMELSTHQIDNLRGWLKLQNWHSKNNLRKLKEGILK